MQEFAPSPNGVWVLSAKLPPDHRQRLRDSGSAGHPGIAYYTVHTVYTQ